MVAYLNITKEEARLCIRWNLKLKQVLLITDIITDFADTANGFHGTKNNLFTKENAL